MQTNEYIALYRERSDVIHKLNRLKLHPNVAEFETLLKRKNDLTKILKEEAQKRNESQT